MVAAALGAVGRIYGLGALGLLLVACGAAAERPRQTSPNIPLPIPQDEAEPAPDLSPVAAPETVVAVARADLGQLSRLPPEVRALFLNWEHWIPEQARTIQRFIPKDTTLEAAVLVDLLTLDRPEPKIAISLGLGSLDSVVEALGDGARRVSPGVYRLEDEQRCVVARARGAHPARLVCSPDGLKELLPYMTRGLPVELLGGEALAQIEVRVRPAIERYHDTISQLRGFASVLVHTLETGDARFDAPLSRTVFALADEALALTRDLDRFTFSVVRAPGNDGVEARLGTHYRGTESWMARLPATLGTKMSSPPAAFWELPADVTSAMYAVAPGTEVYRDIGRHSSDLVDGAFRAAELSAATRKRALGLVERLFRLDESVVYGSGSFDESTAIASPVDCPRVSERKGALEPRVC